jgi:hypothetical protein
VKDHLGGIPFALIHANGRAVAFTEAQYEQARDIAKICRCGSCDCCAVVQYVAEQERSKCS